MQGRPSLEQGSIDEIIDSNLFMEMVLKMGQLGLKCVVKFPKREAYHAQVWQEPKAALFSAENSEYHT